MIKNKITIEKILSIGGERSCAEWSVILNVPVSTLSRIKERKPKLFSSVKIQTASLMGVPRDFLIENPTTKDDYDLYLFMKSYANKDLYSYERRKSKSRLRSNKEYIKEIYKIWKERNKEEISAKRSLWAGKNREMISLKARISRAEKYNIPLGVDRRRKKPTPDQIAERVAKRKEYMARKNKEFWDKLRKDPERYVKHKSEQRVRQANRYHGSPEHRSKMLEATKIYNNKIKNDPEKLQRRRELVNKNLRLKRGSIRTYKKRIIK